MGSEEAEAVAGELWVVGLDRFRSGLQSTKNDWERGLGAGRLSHPQVPDVCMFIARVGRGQQHGVIAHRGGSYGGIRTYTPTLHLLIVRSGVD